MKVIHFSLELDNVIMQINSYCLELTWEIVYSQQQLAILETQRSSTDGFWAISGQQSYSVWPIFFFLMDTEICYSPAVKELMVAVSRPIRRLAQTM